ncbi:MAG: GSCFA domain-containing protein [Maritimibacter sp.]|nr:GSCFA domain-containing protein [Maritimibacter sp.]
MPYSNLPPHAFWRLCRDDPQFRIADIYRPRFRLSPGMKVATAGSCFAQNIGKYIRTSRLQLVDTEPAPRGMAPETAARFGFGLFSARYGNVYTARQLRQLVEDARSGQVHDSAIWERDGRYFDGLRPNTEPDGLGSAGEVRRHRRDHLTRVREAFTQADALIFTLGLTEAWLDRASGVVFPTAPGVVAGHFDPDAYEFANFGMAETFEDLAAALELLRGFNPALKVILTVSPVPLTATASGQHVLAATTYSKAVLRAVAGEMATLVRGVDYFPSYEIVTGTPFAGRFYKDNLRNVTRDGVDTVMRVFFAAQDNLSQGLGTADPALPAITPATDPADDAEICEEAMLEAFGAS